MSCIADKPLTGLKVLAVGKLSKNKDELKAAVEELGGKITSTVNKAAFCLSSKSKCVCVRAFQSLAVCI